MLVEKCLESSPIPETKERKGSGGGTNCGNFTLPPAQHNPVDSPVYHFPLWFQQAGLLGIAWNTCRRPYSVNCS